MSVPSSPGDVQQWMVSPPCSRLDVVLLVLLIKICVLQRRVPRANEVVKTDAGEDDGDNSGWLLSYSRD